MRILFWQIGRQKRLNTSTPSLEELERTKRDLETEILENDKLSRETVWNEDNPDKVTK